MRLLDGPREVPAADARVQLPRGWHRRALVVSGAPTSKRDRWQRLAAVVPAHALVVDGAVEVALLDITFTERAGTAEAGSLRGRDATGTVTVEVSVNEADARGSLNLRFDLDQELAPRRLLPVVHWLSELSSGRAVKVITKHAGVSDADGAPLATTQPLDEDSVVVDPSLLRAVQLLDRLVALTGVPVPVPRTMTAGEGRDLERAVRLLEGETVHVSWDSMRVGFDQDALPDGLGSHGLDVGGPGAMIELEHDHEVRIGKHAVPVGVVLIRTRARRGTIDGEEGLLLEPYAPGEPLTLVLVPQRTDELPPRQEAAPRGPRRRFAAAAAGRGPDSDVSSRFDTYLHRAMLDRSS